MTKLDLFTRAYVTCALWTTPSSLPADNEFALGYNYIADDISDETITRLIQECTEFQAAHWQDVQLNLERAGRDFWLTRNRLLGGFWVSDWPGDVAERLNAAASEYDAIELYVGTDGLIYDRQPIEDGNGSIDPEEYDSDDREEE